MTISSIDIGDVRASVDIAIEELNDSLRKVNHEVSEKMSLNRVLFVDGNHSMMISHNQGISLIISLIDLVQP